MCKRSTGDPLVRKFLDQYGLNLLPQPRERIACGDVFRRDANGNVSSAFALERVVEPAITDDVEVELGEPLGSLEGTLSQARELTVGLGLLQNFLTALGAAGLVDSLGAEYTRNSTGQLRFEFREAEFDSVDAGELGTALIDRRLDNQHPMVLDGSRYFVVTGVARTASLTVHEERSAGGGAGVDVEALQALSANTQVSVRRDGDTTLTYAGDRRLGFGVQLYELAYDKVDGAEVLRLKTPTGPLHVRGALPQEVEPALLGLDDDAFLALAA